MNRIGNRLRESEGKGIFPYLIGISMRAGITLERRVDFKILCGVLG